MYSSVQSYISIKELSDVLETQLFQISALLTYSKIYEKHITIPNQNKFINDTKMFDGNKLDNYDIFKDDINYNYKIFPYGNNIMLDGNFETFKKIDDDILETIRTIVYNNEEYMYEAYKLYNNIKDHFNTNDENIASIYYEDNNDYNLNYYKKSLTIINKKNIVVFSDNKDNLKNIIDDDFNIYYIWHDNIYIRLILLSFFQHNIVQYSKPYYSLWTAYISKYETLKNVVVPDYISTKINRNVNNINFIYLD